MRQRPVMNGAKLTDKLIWAFPFFGTALPEKAEPDCSLTPYHADGERLARG